MITAKFKTPFNTDFTIHTGERNLSPSKTVPDQSMSVSEIMSRYARGLPIEGTKVPVYNGEEYNLPDMEKLDLSEKQQLKENVAKNIDDLKNSLQKAKEVSSPKSSDLAPSEKADDFGETKTDTTKSKKKLDQTKLDL